MKTFNSAKDQRGVAAVEFALVAGIFFTLLIGIMEMSRLLFYWNTATEATRLGARVAVVCALGDTAIKTRMTALFPLISADDIQIDYSPSGCSATTCQQITVRIAMTTPLQTSIPFVPLSLTLPSFSTTLPRESMNSANNPACV